MVTTPNGVVQSLPHRPVLKKAVATHTGESWSGEIADSGRAYAIRQFVGNGLLSTARCLSAVQ
jgi:hypothetical protein